MIDYALSKDISAAIEAHLPQQLGDIFKKRLSDADNDKSLLAAAQTELAARRAEIVNLKESLAKNDALDKRTASVGKREADVTKREQQADLNDLKVKTAEEKTQLIFGLVDRVFRNPVLTNVKTTQDQIPYPPNSGYGMGALQTVTKSETTTQEESR